MSKRLFFAGTALPAESLIVGDGDPPSPLEEPPVSRWLAVEMTDDSGCGPLLAQAAAGDIAGLVLLGEVSGARLQQLDVMLQVAEVLAGRAIGSLPVIAIIERPRDLLRLGDLCGKSTRLTALGWDAAALAVALGMGSVFDDNGEFRGGLATARSMVLLGAAAAGVAAIDLPVQMLDEARLQRHCEMAKQDGFAGKSSAEPAQFSMLRRLFC